MRTLTRTNVEQLLNDFEQMKHSISTVQNQLNHEIQRYLDSPTPIDTDTIKEVTICGQNCEQMLSLYTVGLLRYARSVAKAKEEDRPDEGFLNTVRETRLKAEQIQSDFHWFMDYWNQKIRFHNMVLGDIHAGCMDDNAGEDLEADGLPLPEAPSGDCLDPAGLSGPCASASTPAPVSAAAEMPSPGCVDRAAETGKIS